MKICVVIPDRGDRPEFMENCQRMIENQTIKVDAILCVNWNPENEDCDISKRYRIAYEAISPEKYDCILFIENDDFYAENYIETMVNEWVNYGKPDIFGTNYTIYYHLGILKYTKFQHFKRASMMNTLIKPGLDVKWCADNDPYTDLCLWKQFQGITFEPKELISIGIKHNVGKSGGHYHNDKLNRYNFSDENMQFLKEKMDVESFNFYKKQHEKIQGNF